MKTEIEKSIEKTEEFIKQSESMACNPSEYSSLKIIIANQLVILKTINDLSKKK